jgi:hypothetical protein
MFRVHTVHMSICLDKTYTAERLYVCLCVSVCFISCLFICVDGRVIEWVYQMFLPVDDISSMKYQTIKWQNSYRDQVHYLKVFRYYGIRKWLVMWSSCPLCIWSIVWSYNKKVSYSIHVLCEAFYHTKARVLEIISIKSEMKDCKNLWTLEEHWRI